jgi:hypothetical protein
VLLILPPLLLLPTELCVVWKGGGQWLEGWGWLCAQNAAAAHTYTHTNTRARSFARLRGKCGRLDVPPIGLITLLRPIRIVWYSKIHEPAAWKRIVSLENHLAVETCSISIPPGLLAQLVLLLLLSAFFSRSAVCQCLVSLLQAGSKNDLGIAILREIGLVILFIVAFKDVKKTDVRSYR